MVFRSHPGFIFHDSSGFESGAEKEKLAMQKFIEERSSETLEVDQLHVIWYCVSLDESTRTVTHVEEFFFQKCVTPQVPVVLIFTKYDVFVEHIFGEIYRSAQNQNVDEVYKLAEKLAQEKVAYIFEKFQTRINYKIEYYTVLTGDAQISAKFKLI
ncbi:hypothetical protein H0H81_002685 [Sphagnurus paluster]|uniref:Uncharacterized protein n=1 Tax=Sphagnurus paluster TaxID=117069 RepID=A0A9P7FVL9_9AGAR|nr:hypothetical protein H0H81_002685 [Sphagnurus paluster]